MVENESIKDDYDGDKDEEEEKEEDERKTSFERLSLLSLFPNKSTLFTEIRPSHFPYP